MIITNQIVKDISEAIIHPGRISYKEEEVMKILKDKGYVVEERIKTKLEEARGHILRDNQSYEIGYDTQDVTDKIDLYELAVEQEKEFVKLKIIEKIKIFIDDIKGKPLPIRMEAISNEGMIRNKQLDILIKLLIFIEKGDIK